MRALCTLPLTIDAERKLRNALRRRLRLRRIPLAALEPCDELATSSSAPHRLRDEAPGIGAAGRAAC